MYFKILVIALGLLYVFRPDIAGRAAFWEPAFVKRFWANTTRVRVVGSVLVLVGIWSIAKPGQ